MTNLEISQEPLGWIKISKENNDKTIHRLRSTSTFIDVGHKLDKTGVS